MPCKAEKLGDYFDDLSQLNLSYTAEQGVLIYLGVWFPRVEIELGHGKSF